MKYLLFVFFVTPVFACKLTPESAKAKAQAAALETAAAHAQHKFLQARQEGKYWFVRTTKHDCIEYRIEIDYGKGDCKTTGKVTWMHPCD